VKFGAEPVLRDFLAVLDTLERAAQMDINKDSVEQYKQGIGHLVSQFKKTMEKFGVEEVDPTGHPFDPNLHEALSSVQVPNVPTNSVAQVFRKAYKLHGKVMRTAQVVVNVGESKEGNS
jgi:molecular chaperone GrpE